MVSSYSVRAAVLRPGVKEKLLETSGRTGHGEHPRVPDEFFYPTTASFLRIQQQTKHRFSFVTCYGTTRLSPSSQTANEPVTMTGIRRRDAGTANPSPKFDGFDLSPVCT